MAAGAWTRRSSRPSPVMTEILLRQKKHQVELQHALKQRLRDEGLQPETDNMKDDSPRFSQQREILGK